MAGGLLGTAVTGLKAFQRSLETTSHNISNVNTEGYSRQRVELGTAPAQKTPAGYLGTGVSINNIARSYDQFITTQLRSSTSAHGDISSYEHLATQVDNILADPTVGMAPAMKNFFNAVNEANNDPSSIPARQVLISETEILSSRFGTMNHRFAEIRKQINTDMKVQANEVSTHLKDIADLNTKISNAQGQTIGGQLPNDLLDKRDAVLNELAELMDISVVPGNRGMVNVFMSQGQALVTDTIANKIITQPSEFDPTRLDIAIQAGPGITSLVTRELSGGALAGTLRFRDEILDPAQQRLGSVATSIAMEFNTIHQDGFDLDGKAGGLMFKGQGMGSTEIPVINRETNDVGSSIKVMFDKTNITNINYSDYQLNVGAGPSYSLTRVADNSTIALDLVAGPPDQLVASAPSTDTLPGISIEAAGLVAGDSYLIRPTYSAANSIAHNITDTRKIALATNKSPDNSYTINGPMPGDNRNGLALAGLENNLNMLGGTATFQDTYGLVVSEVGTLTRSAQISEAAQETLLNSAKEEWGNVSGVNLDEEAANLIKFQQSYQAAAQVISVSQSLFDSLLGAVN